MRQTDYTVQSAAVLLWGAGGTILGVSRKYNPNDWGLPAGSIEPGEDAAAAAVRECYEETGIHVTLRANPIYVGRSNRLVCATFLALSYVGEPRAMEEGSVAWVTRDQLLKGKYGSYQKRLFAALVGDVSAETPENMIPLAWQK